jgi:glycosyltransferase involved in cell wall biosynthesis
MKSLYFAAHQFWPLTNGARLRNYQLASQLATRASVTFVEMCLRGEGQQIPSGESNVERVVTLHKDTYTVSKVFRGLAGPVPVTVLNCWSHRSASQLAEVLKSNQFDTVQIAGTQLMAYLPVVQNSPNRPAIVVDWHNIESELMWRFTESAENWAKKTAAGRTAKLIERAEDRLLDSCALHTVTSERERQKLLARRPNANIAVIPNGVDTNYFAPKKTPDACHPNGQKGLKRSVLFVGSMDYHANIDAVLWFSRLVWPEIAHIHPGLQFTIVGRDPVPEIRSLQSDRIRVTGTVGDVRPFYADAVAAIAPIRTASGTRLKILEAMAAGVPVVSTRLGVEGLDVEDDVHLLLADTVQEIASAVGRIVSSAETGSRLSVAARSLVAARYDWSMIGEDLCRIHYDLVKLPLPQPARHESCFA